MIEHWWPTEIGFYDYQNHDKLSLVDYCYKIKSKTKSGGESWISNDTYNTSNHRFHLHKDKKFKKLNDWIIKCVRDYIVNAKLDLKIKLNETESWFNIYKKGDYQEVHQHHGFAISAVYFLKSNPNCSPLIFIPTFFDQLAIERTEGGHCNNCPVEYKAIPGRLIVFRSFLPHCVSKHKDNEERITLAYNFKHENNTRLN
jgi:uncharacterized protein (TIGR02466 family)|tara:strand:+ start:76 stop:675 length:600 start_codon:yes stop_codon:yes gene_type:complete